MKDYYDIDELKLDIKELISHIKILQISVQTKSDEISQSDIDNVLEIALNKLNQINRNVNYLVFPRE